MRSRLRLITALVALLALAACATVGARRTANQGDPVQLETFEYVHARIAATYPDPEMRGLDWDGFREELLPAARAARTADELRPVLLDLLSRLGESHFAVMPPHSYETLHGREDEEPDDEEPAVAADEEAAGAAEPAPAGAAEEERAGDAEAATSEPEPEPEEPGPADLDPDTPGGVGVDLSTVAGRVLVRRVEPGSPADEAGITAGWTVDRVGRRSAASLFELLENSELDLYPELPADALLGRLEGRPGSRVELELRDADDAAQVVELTRAPQTGELVRFGHMPAMVARAWQRLAADGRVGIVGFNVFLPAVTSEYDAAMRAFGEAGVAGVVVDLRGNPGGIGLMVAGMSGWFVGDRDAVLATMTTRESTLRFKPNPRPKSQRLHGRLAILIDGGSASTSEVFAVGLQQIGRARVFGTTSAGMALPSMFEALPNGDVLQFANADLVGPDGERIEGRGVAPDEVVELTREDLLAGRDPVLDRAVAWVLEGADE